MDTDEKGSLYDSDQGMDPEQLDQEDPDHSEEEGI